MTTTKTLISFGDFVDLYHKIVLKGWTSIAVKLVLSQRGRTLSKWNSDTKSSDFWIIPQVRQRWNQKCTGNENIEYEDYLMQHYLLKSHSLRMISIGCGSGSRERKFAYYANFESILGIDLAKNQIEMAHQMAKDQSLTKLQYRVGDFKNEIFPEASFDVVLFNSSLHHFDDVNSLLRDKVMPILKPSGYLVIYEYVGPNRLQWTPNQLQAANQILKQLPKKYKYRLHNTSIKHKVYRPGWLRMQLIDPSEAIDSESILPSIHKYFKTMEEKKVGWDLTHIVFKDIAHHFLNDDPETLLWIQKIFEAEDHYLASTGRSDAVFGIYQKP